MSGQGAKGKSKVYTHTYIPGPASVEKRLTLSCLLELHLFSKQLLRTKQTPLTFCVSPWRRKQPPLFSPGMAVRFFPNTTPSRKPVDLTLHLTPHPSIDPTALEQDSRTAHSTQQDSRTTYIFWQYASERTVIDIYLVLDEPFGEFPLETVVLLAGRAQVALAYQRRHGRRLSTPRVTLQRHGTCTAAGMNEGKRSRS